MQQHSPGKRTYMALAIEDDPDQLTIFTQALQMSGYETESVFDVKSAQDVLARAVPDLILLDLHLPQQSGETLLTTIKNDSRLQNTKVVLATADYQWAEHLREEVDLVLLKPISFKQLRALSMRMKPKQ